MLDRAERITRSSGPFVWVCHRHPGLPDLFERIILDIRSLRKAAAELRDSFMLPHQLEFRQAEFFSFDEVIASFVRQIRLSKRTVDCFFHHDFTRASRFLRSLSIRKVSNDLLPPVLPYSGLIHSITKNQGARR